MAEQEIEKKTLTSDELNALLDTSGAGSVLTPEPDGPKNVFTNQGSNFDIEKIENELSAEEKERRAKEKEASDKANQIFAVLDEATGSATKPGDNVEEEESEIKDEKSKSGRKKEDKSVIVTVGLDLIKKGVIFPFDSEKKPEEYSAKEWTELFEENFKDRDNSAFASAQKNVLESMSPTLQALAMYEFEGGDNLKPVLEAMLKTERSRTLDVEKPEDHEEIVKTWLRFTDFGSEEEIEEEVQTLKDTEGALEKRARRDKPKLDAKVKEQLDKQVAEQRANNQKRQEALQNYHDNIVNILKPSELNGIKIDENVQGMLYNGLTSYTYDSISGRKTNLFGHLIEKYQILEPNHALIAEVLWHLQDPEGFKAKLKTAGEKETTAKHRALLKQEQSNKSATTSTTLEDENSEKRPGKTIPKPNNQFFKRP